jgi:hypothetical protein
MASDQRLVPSAFEVPERLERGGVVLRPLTVDDVVKDYDAVTSSTDHLQALFPDESWPLGLTITQNLIDLAWHQKEFQTRRSFAYTVTTPDNAEVVGCVYIYPTQKAGYDAEVYLWARQSRLAEGLEERLDALVRNWVDTEWPFRPVAFPGRDLDWATWHALPEA